MHISPISEERETSSYTKWTYPYFEGYSRYFTEIAHAYFDYLITVASVWIVLVFTDSDQNFGYKLYQIENFGLIG